MYNNQDYLLYMDDWDIEEIVNQIEKTKKELEKLFEGNIKELYSRDTETKYYEGGPLEEPFEMECDRLFLKLCQLNKKFFRLQNRRRYEEFIPF